MKLTRCSIVLLALSAALPAAWQDAPAPRDAPPTAALLDALGRFGRAGPFSAAARLEEWHDARRQRDLPVKLWFPRDDAAVDCPVVLFSHGLGGTREHYAYFGHHLASHGYVVVHLQHPGSDDTAWRGQPQPLVSMRRASADPANLLGRPADVSFAIDQLERLDADAEWPLRGRIDLAAIAVAGHSFGAYTALCAAGRVLAPPIGRPLEVADPRVRACIALSSPANERDRSSGAYAAITVPCLHLTGTRDVSPIGETSAELRRLPFEASLRADRSLIVLTDAEHLAFSDAGAGLRARDPAHHPLILAASTAFLAATLREDEAAGAWLLEGDFTRALGRHGTFEHRAAAR